MLQCGLNCYTLLIFFNFFKFNFIKMIQFKFKKVTGEDELKEIFKLRYKVYCEEWGFENPSEHPERLEFDEFDKHSIHFAAIEEDANQLIGTVRIILNSEKGFPIERHCKIDTDLTHIKRDKIGEISRLAISKVYRRRLEDHFTYEAISKTYQDLHKVPYERRRRQEIVIGLYKCIYVESKRIGLTHWYAIMGQGLFLLLQRMGIAFKSIGPEINYHGVRKPYVGHVEEMEKTLSKENPELFKEFAGELNSY